MLGTLTNNPDEELQVLLPVVSRMMTGYTPVRIPRRQVSGWRPPPLACTQ
jgi:hypothetical protein